MKEIKRDIYLNRLIRRRENGLIKVITGIRRSGKSYLLDPIFRNYLLSEGIREDHIIKIELDRESNRRYYHDPHAFDQYIRSFVKDEQMYYIILDEIQLVDDFEYILNGLLYEKNVDVYVTGSNSKFLSSDIITEFRGRGDQIRVQPLSFSEYLPACGIEDKYDAWNEYMTYGGMPFVVSIQEEQDKAAYLKNLFEQVYFRDILERYDIRRKDILDSLVNFLASSVGSLTNPQKIYDTFKSNGEKELSLNTISSYLSYLEDAFIVNKAERYDIKGRKYISTPQKYYFTDLGLRNARLNFRQQEPTHILENIVYNELLVRGYNVDVGIVDVFAKNSEGKRVHKQLEVDFVVNQGSQRYYIQVAYDMTSEEKQTQELNSFRNIPDSFKKIVIVNGTKKPWRNEEGFVIMGMKYFLLNADSLEF